MTAVWNCSVQVSLSGQRERDSPRWRLRLGARLPVPDRFIRPTLPLNGNGLFRRRGVGRSLHSEDFPRLARRNSRWYGLWFLRQWRRHGGGGKRGSSVNLIEMLLNASISFHKYLLKGLTQLWKSRRIYPKYMPKCSVGSTDHVCKFLLKNFA